MIGQETTIVLVQYGSQALLALIVMLLLNKFYKNYQNKYFQYWSWSWLGLMIYFVGSGIALTSALYLSTTHPLRTISSTITIAAGLFQAMWLLIGSYELSKQKELNKKWVTALSFLILPLALTLVMAFINDPGAIVQRLFFRVGIKALISGFTFVFSTILIFKLRKSGIGIKFILLAFLLYGIEQFNYFLSFLAPVLDFEYILETPYFLGIFDFLLQTIMGIGMIISVLELEQVQLKKANNELDTFLYRSSHDLRAPLTTILGLVYAIKSETSKEETDGYVDLIENRVHQADKVIKDIITLRKGQKTGLEISKVHIKKLVHETLDMLRSPLNDKIEMEYDSEIEEVSTDREKLKTVILNILANAIKYHNLDQESPYIKVLIKKDELDNPVISICDNGVGIKEKYLPKIFDMFYRANPNSKGSGLGLYLVKDAIDHLEGEINVESEEGKGTCFTFKIKNAKF